MCAQGGLGHLGAGTQPEHGNCASTVQNDRLTFKLMQSRGVYLSNFIKIGAVGFHVYSYKIWS